MDYETKRPNAGRRRLDAVVRGGVGPAPRIGYSLPPTGRLGLTATRLQPSAVVSRSDAAPATDATDVVEAAVMGYGETSSVSPLCLRRDQNP